MTSTTSDYAMKESVIPLRLQGNGTTSAVSIVILTKNDLEEARDLGKRLAVEATRLMATVPTEYHGPYLLARYLGADRSACQRLYAAVANVDEETVARAPGPKALTKLAEAISAKGVDPSIAVGLLAAAARMDVFFKAIGGNQRAYEKRLLLTRQFEADPRGLANQSDDVKQSVADPSPSERHFKSASELAGRSSECMVRMMILRPSRTNPGKLDVIGALGYVGYRQLADQVPPLYSKLVNIRSSVPIEQAVNWKGLASSTDPAPNFLISEFSSAWWRISNVPSETGTVRLAELEPHKRQASSNLFFADASFGLAPDPRFYENGSDEFWIGVHYPTRRLIFDVYLQHDYARCTTHIADVHLLQKLPQLGDEHLRWLTRIGEPNQLIHLGTGLSAASTDTYPSYRELAEHLFKTVRWDPQDFVGFRYDVPYPIWRADYRMYFQYGHAKDIGQATEAAEDHRF